MRDDRLAPQSRAHGDRAGVDAEDRRGRADPETHARATAVAGTIRNDGATVAATLLFDAVSRERPPASA
jgi:hypothetical protein